MTACYLFKGQQIREKGAIFLKSHWFEFQRVAIDGDKGKGAFSKHGVPGARKGSSGATSSRTFFDSFFSRGHSTKRNGTGFQLPTQFFGSLDASAARRFTLSAIFFSQLDLFRFSRSA